MKARMTKLKKLITTTLIVSSVLVLNPIPANAEWEHDSLGWRYKDGKLITIGWKLIDGNWYYFFSNGYMAHDTTINGYYLNSNGAWTKSKTIVDKLKGTWNTSFMTGSNIPLTITDTKFGPYSYSIAEQTDSTVTIDVSESSGFKRYLIQIASNDNKENLIISIHNDNNDGYTEISEGMRIQ